MKYKITQVNDSNNTNIVVYFDVLDDLSVVQASYVLNMSKCTEDPLEAQAYIYERIVGFISRKETEARSVLAAEALKMIGVEKPV